MKLRPDGLSGRSAQSPGFPERFNTAQFDKLRPLIAVQAALPALNAYPNDPEVLLMTVTAALIDRKPDHALRFLHRFTRKWQSLEYEDQLLRAIALAQQGHWPPGGDDRETDRLAESFWSSVRSARFWARWRTSRISPTWFTPPGSRRREPTLRRAGENLSGRSGKFHGCRRKKAKKHSHTG